MRVVLPSQGILGTREVEIESPKYKHIRDLCEVSYAEEEIGYQFVRSLIHDPSVMDTITFQDKDYLVAIAVSSLHINEIPLIVNCSCGEKIRIKFDISESEVFDLEPNTPKSVEKKIGGDSYQYHFLSANEEQEIVQWAKSKSDGSNEKYKKNFEEAFVCKTFGYPLSEENIIKVVSYDILVYYSALLFREMSFHGVSPMMPTTCPKCGKSINVVIPFAKSLMNWSSSDVINEFLTVSNLVGGFQSFLDLTMGDVNQMKEFLNAGGK